MQKVDNIESEEFMNISSIERSNSFNGIRSIGFIKNLGTEAVKLSRKGQRRALNKLNGLYNDIQKSSDFVDIYVVRNPKNPSYTVNFVYSPKTDGRLQGKIARQITMPVEDSNIKLLKRIQSSCKEIKGGLHAKLAELKNGEKAANIRRSSK